MADAKQQAENRSSADHSDHPRITVTAERRISSPSLTARSKARLKIGSINGSTSIALITTAVLLEIRPKVAIPEEQISRTKNQRGLLGGDACLVKLNPWDSGFQIYRPVAGEQIGEAQDRVGHRHGTLADLWRQN